MWFTGGKKQSTDGLQRLLIYHNVRGSSSLTPQELMGCVTQASVADKVFSWSMCA